VKQDIKLDILASTHASLIFTVLASTSVKILKSNRRWS